MLPLLVYAIPFLASITSGALLFAFPLEVSQATGDTFLSGMVVLVAGGTYVAMTAALMWRKPGDRASMRLVYAGLIALVLAGILPALWLPSWPWIYFYTAFQGLGSAAFLVSFQIVLQVVAVKYSIAVAFSNFIMSWALGYAVGPFITGLFSDSSRAVPLLFAAGCALLALLLLVAVRRVDFGANAADPQPLPVDRGTVRFGWALIFASGFFLTTFRGVLPDFGEKSGLVSSTTGTMLLVMFVVVFITAWAMRRIYLTFVARPAWFWVILACYAGACLLLASGGSAWSGYAAMVLLGIPIAIGYFFAGVFALSDAPNKSRNVGVNETVVGVAAIGGPLLGSLLARQAGYSWFFLASLGLSVLVFVAGFAQMSRVPKTAIPGGLSHES